MEIVTGAKTPDIVESPFGRVITESNSERELPYMQNFELVLIRVICS